MIRVFYWVVVFIDEFSVLSLVNKTPTLFYAIGYTLMLSEKTMKKPPSGKMPKQTPAIAGSLHDCMVSFNSLS